MKHLLLILSSLLFCQLSQAQDVYSCESVPRDVCRSASVHCTGGHVLTLNGEEIEEFGRLHHKNTLEACLSTEEKLKSKKTQRTKGILSILKTKSKLECAIIPTDVCRSTSVYCTGGHALRLNGEDLETFPIFGNNTGAMCYSALKQAKRILKSL